MHPDYVQLLELVFALDWSGERLRFLSKIFAAKRSKATGGPTSVRFGYSLSVERLKSFQFPGADSSFVEGVSLHARTDSFSRHAQFWFQ